MQTAAAATASQQATDILQVRGVLPLAPIVPPLQWIRHMPLWYNALISLHVAPWANCRMRAYWQHSNPGSA